MGILILPCLLLFFLLHPVATSANCPSSTCGNLTIRFPFRLIEGSPECGHPGFELTCIKPQTQAILTLPGSKKFQVRKIDYFTQSIQVNDLDHCLPKKLIDFSLLGSPLIADLSTNYTLLGCPRDLETPSFPSVRCLSTMTQTAFAILSDGSENTTVVYQRCREMGHLTAPRGNLSEFLLGGVLELRWDLPMCEECESNGGMCVLDDHMDILCESDPAKGGSPKLSSLHIFEMVALSVSIPGMASMISVGVWWCLRSNRGRHRSTQRPVEEPDLQTAVVDGLDQDTIDSYNKVILGESKRVPGRNSDSCHICLSDFNANETLRCMPECDHCFHADCIDEWLRIKSSCPLCRKLPSRHESARSDMNGTAAD